MRKIDALLSDYASHHTTNGNVVCHFVGIPLIVFGIFSMLQRVRVVPLGGNVVTGAEVFIAAAMLYYFFLDVRLACAMLAASLVLDFAALKIADWRVGLAAFVVGWIFQGIGHAVYEKRSPAFLKNMVHLMVGPLFVLNEALHLHAVKPAES